MLNLIYLPFGKVFLFLLLLSVFGVFSSISAGKCHPSNVSTDTSGLRFDKPFIDYAPPHEMNLSKHYSNAEVVDAVVELAIFCDVDFSAIFNYNIKAIREYWTVYLHDVTLRFRTITSAHISFRISSLTMFTECSQQPFIENARSANGTISVNQTNILFSKWIYQTRNSMPKFDVAMLVTNSDSNDDIGGIVSGLGGACTIDHLAKRHNATMTFIDYGKFDVYVGVHELGHILGAYHDFENDIPGGCTEKDYIMTYSDHRQKQYFFSSCSNRFIGDFLRSDKAQCLHQIDNPKSRLASIPAPSRLKQCQQALPGIPVFVKNDSDVCSFVNCFWYEGNSLKSKTIRTVDNTPCDNERHCFRDRCIRSGNILQNVGANICTFAGNQFTASDNLSTFSCIGLENVITPLEKLAITPGPQGGFIISAPYSVHDETGEKCLWSMDTDGGAILFKQCEEIEESLQIWDKVFDSNKKYFILKHRKSGRCAKVVDKKVIPDSACNIDDPFMLWTCPKED